MTDSTGHVFSRVWGRRLPTAIRADGVWIEGSDGRRYLDAAGGAIVNGVGHGNRTVIDAIAAQLARVDYVHAHSFTTEALESYADAVSAVAPLSDPKVFPVSGGSEAAETAIKLARTYHLARGEPERTVVLARQGSYHGNTLGALDASGRVSLRAGYEPWLGRFDHLPAANEYRCPNPSHPSACGAWHAGRLEAAIERIGSHRVAAFIAEPIVGATLGAVEPPEDYWPAVAEVCRRHGVLVIADEVMTGFGRTGRWFAIEHWGTRPDIVIAGKGAGSGYWPLGLCIASSDVWATAAPRFHHGFTYSHHPVGAAAGSAVIEVIRSGDLVERSAGMGAELRDGLRSRLGDHPRVGDIRGRGLLVGVELVADRERRSPFPRSEAVTERVVGAAMEHGLILYPVTGCADGADGDGVLLGPPLVIGSDEVTELVERLTASITAVLG